MSRVWALAIMGLLGVSVPIAAALPASGVAATTCNPERDYCPSPLQVRVDRSFSDIAIDTPQRAVSEPLTEVRIDGCETADGCDWRDADGVRYFFWGDPSDLWVVVKTVRADEFFSRPIRALGIGLARQREDVLANVRRFLGDVPLNCIPESSSHNRSIVGCHVVLDPGWIRIWFDKNGQLLEARFDGYHFI